MDDIRAEVLGYIAETTGHPDLAEELTGNTSLRGIGLDSFGLFDLISGLEARFGIEIGDEEFQMGNFETVDDTARFIHARRGDHA